MARTISVSDEQLLLFAKFLHIAERPTFAVHALRGVTEEDCHEALILAKHCEDTAKMPEDRELVHGFCL